MVRIALQFKADLENLTNVKPEGEDFRWYLKLQCQNCGEDTKDWIYMSLGESQAIKGSRGNANFVSKCKLCGRENSMDIIRDSISEYTIEDSNTFKTMVAFDCRGLEPFDFSPRFSGLIGMLQPLTLMKASEFSGKQVGFVADAVDSASKFSDINLTEKDWSDYDEEAGVSVGIYEVTHQFLRL
nr:CXXC motif containing zinc binding protein-like isoform X1 [Pocillopora verrucosa]